MTLHGDTQVSLRVIWIYWLFVAQYKKKKVQYKKKERERERGGKEGVKERKGEGEGEVFSLNIREFDGFSKAAVQQL